MFNKIVVGHDQTDHGEDALALGRLLARSTEAELILAHVLGDEFPPELDWQETERESRASIKEDLAAAASAEDVPAEAQAVAGSSAAQGLNDIAEAQGADLIVVGASHLGAIGRILSGSVPEQLVHDAPCAVAVAPEGFAARDDSTLEQIGVAFDGSAESRAAAGAAAQLAAEAGASVRVLSVLVFGDAAVGDEHADASERERVERDIAAAIAEMDDVPAQRELLEGEVAEALVSRAKQGIDLLVAGSRGHGAIRRALFGSVTTQLARSAPCPLLVLPGG